eukprot:13630-Heterococcus_DN1.PRE.8
MESGFERNSGGTDGAAAIASGEECLRKGDFEATLEHFQSAIAALDDEQATKIIHCREQAALALFKLGRYEEAEAMASAVLSLQPASRNALHTRGQARLQLANPRPAMSDLSAALPLCSSARERVDTSRLLEAAEAAAGAQAEQDPRARGLELLREGRAREAVACLAWSRTKLKATNSPLYPDCLLDLSLACTKAGDLQAGITALEEGLDTNKLKSRMRVTFHALKSALHMSRGENTAAIEGYSVAAATLRREIALKAQQGTSNNSSSSGSGEGSSGHQSSSVDESSQDKQQRADEQQEHDELSDERLIREATEELCS